MNPIRASLIMSSLAAMGVAQAQTATAPAPAAPVVVTKSDAGNSLTWNGITLYGIVDIGLQYQTHGVPISATTSRPGPIRSFPRTATARSRE